MLLIACFRDRTSQEKRDKRRERARLRQLEFKGTNHCSVKEASKVLGKKRKQDSEESKTEEKAGKKGKKTKETKDKKDNGKEKKGKAAKKKKKKA
jgi:hypothetical protein